MKINILGLCEVRWKGSGKITSDDFTIIYSGGAKHEKGVAFIIDKLSARSVKGFWAVSDRVIMIKLSTKPLDLNIIQVYAPTSESTDEELDSFYDEIEQALKQCKSTDITIVQGDFNAKVGKGRYEDTVGSFGLGERNNRGQILLEWAHSKDFAIGNTWFVQHPRRLATWRSPGDNCRNQIDFFMIKKRFRNALTSCKAYPGADCDSDHYPVVSKICLRLKTLKTNKCEKQLDLALLKNSEETRTRYAVEVKNRFQALQGDPETDWNNLKECLIAAANETLPARNRDPKSKWMTTEILDLMRSRRNAKMINNEPEYRNINREIKRKCNEAKEAWLNSECEKIEQLYIRDSKTMHQKIRIISGKKSCCANGALKDKDGNVITDKDKILKRWEEYIGELYNSERNESFTFKNNFEGPPILQDEVRCAFSKMKHGKAPGPDKVTIEMLDALEDYGIELVTKLINSIYETGDIPSDLLKSTFIALPKKPGAIECGLHRTISLMSHLTKVLLRIVMLRARKKIKPEIAEEQCGFVEGKGTANGVYILRTLSERALEVQQDLYLCFIDYTKAFDTVKHEAIMKILEDINIDGKDLRIIQNIYWKQTATIRVDNELSRPQPIKRGVRQGCVLSPDLFSLYSEIIMRNIEGMPGVKVGGQNINNLRYADDTVLIAGSEEDLQHLVNIINEESEKMGLSLNVTKTECMVVSKKNITPTCKIILNGKTLKQVTKFKYLGTLITPDARCTSEINSRIAQAKVAFENMGNIMKSKKISIHVRKRVLNTYVYPILTYASEGWNITKQHQKRLEATEMWFLRRMLRISYKDHMKNEDVLRRADTSRSLISFIRKRQARFFGHVMRRPGMENNVTTGKICGKRDRGRQREKMIDGLTAWLRTSSPTNTIASVWNRSGWKTMIAEAVKHGT